MSALKIAINVLAVLSFACATTDEPDVCQAPLSSAESKLRSPSSNRSDFLSFAGLSFGATREDVLERFGEPEWIEGVEDPKVQFERLDYFHGALSILIDPKTNHVFKIELTNGFALFGGAGIQEKTAEFLAHDVARVFEAYGPPDRAYRGWYEYDILPHEVLAKVTATFVCHPLRQCRCDYIWVQWHPDLTNTDSGPTVR